MSQRRKEDLWLEIMCFITLLVHAVTADVFYLKKLPSKKEVEEGSRMSYECLAVPSDRIIYKWSHNDRPITLNHHRSLGPDNRTLIIDHVDRDIDPGAYNCLAQNSSSQFARKSSIANLYVNWLDPKVEIKMLQPTSMSGLKTGGNLLLKCDANASPQIIKDNIIWFFNGNGELPDGIQIQKDGSLLVEAIRSSHNGFFHCQIFHSTGRLDSKLPFVLSIEDQMLNPSEFSIYAKEGSEVVLKCPWINERLAWSRIVRLGDPLLLIFAEPPANVVIKDTTLTIKSMDSSADAYYVCQIMAKPKTKSAVFRVSLAKMYDFKRNQFSPPLDETEHLVIREGENGGIRFYIDLTPSNGFAFDSIPNPAPKISWEYGGTEIPKWNGNSDTPPPRKHVFRNRHLIIQNATLSDRGSYIIKMSNEAGQRIRTFNIIVTFPPIFDVNSQEEVMYINEDESKTLDCKITKMQSSQDVTSVYWKKDGFEITSFMPGITYLDNGKKVQITKAKSENTGSYQCFVKTHGFPEFSNKIQTVNVKAKLQFTGLNMNFFLEIKTNGSIPCKTKGFGQIQIKWYDVSNRDSDQLRGRPVPISWPHRVLSNGTLMFINIQKIYAGQYMCEARSYSTNEVINRTIQVKVGEKPKIILISANKTIQEGSPLELECRASGDPKPSIRWVVDNNVHSNPFILDAPKKENERWQVLKNGTLIIRSATLSDEAKYTCLATNSQLNTAEEAVSVKVLTPEEYSRISQKHNLNKGMVKTIIIVVSCAVAYLALIIGLTAFCSLRMLKHRRNRTLTEKLGDNSQLMRPLAGSNQNDGCNSNDRMTNKSFRNMVNNSATNNYLPQVPFSSSHGYYTQYNPVPMPMYIGNPLIDTNASEFQHLMSAPPPTPLESRSNFSGNQSSTNSASLYTRSQFSSSTNGGMTGLGMNSMERLTYPRHELQTEGILGKGEFGEVFLARARNILDGESQSLVVVKSLMNNEPSHCHEFHRQLDLLVRTDSDFVAKLLGICIEIEPWLLILEYCEWGDLKQFLQCMQDRSNPKMPLLNRLQKLSICAQISTGMAHIASIRCVHKDLAARNILLTPQLNIKISHLGLCRDLYQGEYYKDGDKILPIRWMPPESVLKSEFSLQSDVWSFAVTCWEIFSLGSLPMPGYKNEEILDLLASCSSLNSGKVQAMYGSLEQFPGDCPQTFVMVIKRCLYIDALNRPNFTDISKSIKDMELTK